MYWEIYAYVLDGIIKNIAVFSPDGGYTNANLMAKEIYGQLAYAVNVTDYPVQIGDTVDSYGDFYRGRVQINKLDLVGDRITDVEMALVELASIITEEDTNG